ncbi:branched-chain amino acid ABC transporter permease [Variovorax defluvii]|uniref:Branched-chain amino acid ABC transporter permease n=1 Tax=Variovorax defluvii TaxID=913761 RepID=A0ABP8HEP9_9BURK
MNPLIEQTLIALSKGGIYANLALALVMTYKSSGQVNFAQGEMATVATFIAWSLAQAGLPLWLAIALAVVCAGAMGLVLERVVIRPFRRQPVAIMVTVSVGLFIALNSLSGWLWSYEARPFASPFPDRAVELGGVMVRWHALGAMAVSTFMLLAMFAFFRWTKLGLAMRGAAANDASARLLGIHVDRMIGLGWATAAMVGAVAGIMMAPFTFLDPHMMSGPLIFFFAAALLGGISSPLGAVAGGYAVGLLELAVVQFVPKGNELRTTLAMALIVAVLLLRPQGLFGARVVHRV